MNSASDSTNKVDVLLKEHEIICTQIREMVSYSDRIFGFGVTILGAVFLYGIKETAHAITIATPFAVTLLLLFCSSIYAAILSLGGYRRYLEDKLSSLLGERLLMWEHITPRILHNSFAVASLSAFSTALLFASMYLGWSMAESQFTDACQSYLGAGYAASFLILLGSFLKLRRSHSEAYLAASGRNFKLPLFASRSALLAIPPFRATASRLSSLRGEDIFTQIAPMLSPSSSVLDLGCGTGGVSLALMRGGFDVVAADIIDVSLHAEIQPTLVHPRGLPFQDNQFDVCIMHMTLHHAYDPELLLNEARRVARTLIVGEELVNTAFGKLALAIYDSIVNLAFIGEPHGNMSDQMWRGFFSENGLSVATAKYTRIFGFIKQAIYLLEKR